MLYEKINEDLKSALKGKREFELGVLRMLSAALHNREIEKKTSGQAPTLTDEDVIEVLGREAKKRREAAEVYGKGSRPDLQEKEIKEADLIDMYLPAKMSVDEIEAIVKKVIKSGVSDFGSVMKEVMKELKGKADGKAVGEAVKKLLVTSN